MKDAFTYVELRDLVKDPLALRVTMVQYALVHGVKPTAKTYDTSPQTVRLWLRRYREEGLSGLKELPRKRKTEHPQATPKEVEQTITQLRKAHPSYGQDTIARLLERQGIRVSGKTVGKILHRHGLIDTKAKSEADHAASHISHLEPFAEVQVDIADLTESEGYAEAIDRGLLPRYEFSLRDLSTGAGFLSYAKTLDAHNILCFAQKVLWHLQVFDLKPKVLHALDGSAWLRHKLDKELIDFLREQNITPHLVISNPSSLPWRVTTFHQLIDLELYQKTPLQTEAEFYQKALEFERFFNVQRRDSKRRASPLEFAQKRLPELPMAVMEFQPFCLDDCNCNGVSQ
jgi:transposase